MNLYLIAVTLSLTIISLFLNVYVSSIIVLTFITFRYLVNPYLKKRNNKYSYFSSLAIILTIIIFYKIAI